MRPALQTNRIPGQIGRPVSPYHNVPVWSEDHRCGRSSAQLAGDLRDDPVLEPMHPPRRAVHSDHAIESDPVLPQGVYDLVGIDAPRSIRIGPLDTQEAVGPLHGEYLVFRQEVDALAFSNGIAQRA